jgi:hypothetical protein
MKRLGIAIVMVTLMGNGRLLAQAVEPAVKKVEKVPGVDPALLKQAVGKGSPASPLAELQATVSGTFWRNPKWVETMGLTSDQQRKMDEVFQQYRLRLVDLTATLQKEELVLEPLLANMPPSAENGTKIQTQIDRIADSRAELEKANSKMLFGILQLLNKEQFDKLPMPRKVTVGTKTRNFRLF